MALLKNKVVNPEETQETVETSEAPAPEEKAVTARAQAAPPAESLGPVMPTIAELEDVMDPTEYGNVFPRIVGTNGALYNDGTSYGEWIDVNVFSHSVRWFITPVADDKDEQAKNFCRASYDGKTIPDRDGGPSMTIDEYKAEMSDEYDEFEVKKYHDIYVVIMGSEKNAEAAKAAGILQVSCSPTSVKGFNAFKMQTKLFAIRGQMLPTHQNCMRIKAIPMQTKQGKNYVMMGFEPIPVDIVTQYEPVTV